MMREPAAMQMASSGPEARRTKVFLGSVLFLSLMCAAGGCAYLFLAADYHLNRTLRETDARDPGWRLLEVEANRAVVADEQNSALDLIKAKGLLPPKWPFWQQPVLALDRKHDQEELNALEESFRDQSPVAQLSDRQLKALRQEVPRAAAALAEVHKIADKPHGRFPLTIARDFISTSIWLSHDNTRPLVALLPYEAMLRAHDRDMDGALESCRCMIQAQRAIGDEPFLISMLNRTAMRHEARNAVERVLAQGQPSEHSLARLQRLLEQEAETPLLLIAARGERGMSDGCLQALQMGQISFQQIRAAFDLSSRGLSDKIEDQQIDFSPTSLKNGRSLLLRYSNQIVEMAKLPAEEQRRRFKDISIDPDELPHFVRILTARWEKLVPIFHRDAADQRCIVTLVAAERFRRAQGRWPERLEELVPRYLAMVPRDPFDGAPLRLRSTSDGLLIYSVGDDEQDNGGNIDNRTHKPGSDRGFRLWDVGKRRQ
jgi:hypothetical protein